MLVIVAATFLVSDFLFGSATAGVATVLTTAFLAYAWFVMPIRHRLEKK